MKFRILGALEVAGSHGIVVLRPSRQAALLTVLLSNANRTVTVSELLDAVWGGQGELPVEGSLYTAVNRVRAQLGRAELDGGDRLATTSRGYLLQVGPDELDVDTFQSCLERARQAMGEGAHPAAIELFQMALALWRGPALAGVPGWFAESYAARLDDARLTAVEDLMAARLAVNEEAVVLSELEELVAAHPFRERLRGHLMTALQRVGRQSEALRVYRDGRQTLVENLGIEPGPELQELHQRVLGNQPAADRPKGTGDATAGVPRVPRQLPADVGPYLGRDTELARLDVLADAQSTGHRATVCVIDGGAGMGKTALALRWAHRWRDRFPDGELFVDLRGFDARMVPARPEDVLERILRALRTPPDDIPPVLDDRAALYRTLLCDKRMLVILDNAATEEQVRPLLPGTAGCSVIVTSRSRLSGLVVRDGAFRVTVDSLPPMDAAALLRAVIGDDRVNGEHAAVAQLVDVCSGIPLALRLAAERVAVHTRVPVGTLVNEISDQRNKLSMLTLDNHGASLRTVFDGSYGSLGREPARLFRLLGVFPGHDISVAAVAVLAGVPASEANLLVDVLTGLHLLEEADHRRYRLHDLLREYAAECAEGDGTADAHTALERLFDWYLHTAVNASNAILPPGRPRSTVPDERARRPDAMRFPTYQSAEDWCESERQNLLAVVEHCADTGLTRIATQLPAALWSFYQVRSHVSEWTATQRAAVRAARDANDPKVEAPALTNLGTALVESHQFDEGISCYEQAMALAERVGDQWVVMVSVVNIGEAYRRCERYEEAVQHFDRALAMSVAAGNKWVEGFALNCLAGTLRGRGDHAKAISVYRKALATNHEVKDFYTQAKCYSGIGQVYWDLHDYPAARRSYLESLRMSRELGDRRSEAQTLRDMGDLLWQLGELTTARSYWRDALTLARALDDELILKDLLTRPTGVGTQV